MHHGISNELPSVVFVHLSIIGFMCTRIGDLVVGANASKRSCDWISNELPSVVFAHSIISGLSSELRTFLLEHLSISFIFLFRGLSDWTKTGRRS